MKRGGGLAERLTATVESAFEGQAAAAGRVIADRAMELRRAHPMATFLQDTFTRQVRKFGEAAHVAHEAKDKPRALEMAAACDRAGTNLANVVAAIEGTGGDL